MTASSRDIRRWRWPLAAGAVVALAALVTFLVVSGQSGDDSPTRAQPSQPVAVDDAAEGGGEPAPQAQTGPPPAVPEEQPAVAPASEARARQGDEAIAGGVLDIPAIGVSTPLITLGLNADGTMEVPSNFADAGWYRYSPLPGHLGPAIIAGHVDSRSGPAVFHRLSELRPGDQAVVRYPNGSAATFAVSHVEQHPKDAFPHERVYGDTAAPELRLITCGGVFDRSRGAHRDNIIVYATLVG